MDGGSSFPFGLDEQMVAQWHRVPMDAQVLCISREREACSRSVMKTIMAASHSVRPNK
ncbi:hypothetical protein BC567DRAFT_238604 [Phyllosticta citribraziliensis]